MPRGARSACVSSDSEQELLAGGLGELPMLAGLPDELRELVERSFVTVHYEFGEAVFSQGEPPDGYYVIVDGVARVLTTGDDGQEVSLNVLTAGATFGEGSLLEGTPRTATVRASSPLTVLRLDRGVFDALTDLYPSVGDAFEVAARTRKVNDFLRVHSAFAVLRREATLELVDRLEDVTLPDGTVVVRQDDPSDALYLVQDGRLGVFIDELRVRTLHTGEFFGELGLLHSAPRAATVRAEGPVQLLRLAGPEFQRLVSDHPEFAARVQERIALYELRDRRPAPAEPLAPQLEPDTWSVADPGLALTDYGEEIGKAPLARRRRFAIVRQIDANDCGAACLAMVCRAFGHDVSLTAIRHAAGTQVDGTTLRGLQRGGEEIGLSMRTIKSSPDRVDSLPLPAILHWQGNHWVVLYRVDADKLRIADPARGPVTVTREQLDERWSGYAALASPTPRLALAPRGGLHLRCLAPFVRPHRNRVLWAGVLALIAAGLEMTLAVFAQQIIDHVIGQDREGLLYALAAAMAGVIALAVAITTAQRLVLARAASELDGDTLDFLSTRLLRLPMRYFETRRSSDIERRLSGVEQVREVLVGNGMSALTAVAQLAVALVIMFVYSWSLALLYVALSPLYVGLMRYSARRLRPVFDSAEEGQSRYHARQVDAVRGIETVKAVGAEEGLRRRATLELRDLRDRLRRADLVAMVYEGVVSTLGFFIYAVFLFAGAFEVLHRDLSVGSLVAVSALVLLANTPVTYLGELWDRLHVVTVVLGRLQDVFDQEPEQGIDRSRLRRVEALEGHIRLRRVGFAYASAPDREVLHDLSLDVPAGTTVALVGRSGSGKSTLAKCVAGLLVPTSGAIEYDGMDMRELRLSDLRRRIGFVLQQPYLFDDTIEANIAFGEERADPMRVRWAAEAADLADFVDLLPLGYATRIGDSGMRLSGGQAQRVAIARALYHQPPVLILDEATSALDTEAERSVKQNMDRLLKGRTAFVIAHRLSTIRDAHIICVLEQGRLVEMGNHEELLRRQGLYAYLQAQQLEE